MYHINYSLTIIKLFFSKEMGWGSILFIMVYISSCQNNKKRKESDSHKKLICLYTEDPIIIDARFNEKGWEYAKSVTLKDDSLSSQDTRRSMNKVLVRTLWDRENLYISFKVQDRNLQAKDTVQDSPQLSRDDIVEFLVDTRDDRDSCWGPDDIIYHINLLGKKKDDRGTIDCKSDSKWNGNAKIAVRLFGSLNDSTDIDTGYNVEVAIPWKELDIKPLPGTEMRIDFGNGDSGIFFDWVGAWPFRSPYAFGDLILKNEIIGATK